MAATRKTGHCSAVVQFGTRIPLSSPRSTKRAQFSEPSGIRTVIAFPAGKNAADLPRRFAMVRGDGYYAARWRQNAARVRACRRRADALLSRLGPGAGDPDGWAPDRLDPVAAASMGRADCLLYPQGDGRAASAHAGII